MFAELGFQPDSSTTAAVVPTYVVVLFDGIRIALSDRPTPRQPSNAVVLKSTGTNETAGDSYAAILERYLNVLCKNDAKLEAKLAERMQFAQNGRMPSRAVLQRDGFASVDFQHVALARFFFLTVVKEISRRAPLSLGQQAEKGAARDSVPTLAPVGQDEDRFPFAQALIRS